MSKNLFDGSSDSETELTEFKTNREYAKSYNKFREKELLKRLKDRDKDISDSSSDDDSESSDEEVVINKKFDEEFFKTLASLKSKNPEIYDKNTKFFKDIGSDDEVGNKKEKKKKAMTIKDYERKVILEKGGKYEDDDDTDNDTKENARADSPSYADEQKKLRHEIKKALDSDEDEEEFGGIFRRREKTKEEKEKEEEEHAVWLAGKKEEISEDAAKTLNPLKQYWSNPTLPKQEQFLRDYILSNGYQNKDHDEIPTYDEIVGNFSEDEAELEKQAEFEEKFNFRFEEPDKEFIKRYPRTIESTVRRTDDKRKQKRVEVKERKLKEKEQKFKELEMLKEIKRKEILEKIEKLKEVTGNEELPFKEEELDEDFDPEAHDRRMQEIFNEEYYGEDEGEDKPDCPDIDELKVEDWDNFDPKQDGENDDDYEPHCEDEDFNMDCDYNPETSKQALQDELIESTKGRRKRKRRNQFMEMIKKEKPVFNPEDEKSYAEYIDEYYKMDCEDIIGDIPCRFKYVETTPNDFGLTIEEILLAKNKELNQWVSLKKAIQIRPEHVEQRDRKLYKMKAKNEALKKKIFRSIYGPPSDEEGEEENAAANSSVEKKIAEGPTSEENNTKKKKKKKKKQKTDSVDEDANKDQVENSTNSSQTDGLNGINGKLETNQNVEVNQVHETSSENINGSQADKKKKKKKKKKGQNETNDAEKGKVPERQETTNSKTNKNAGNKVHNAKNPFQNTRNSQKTRNPFQGSNKKNENNIYNKMSDERLKAYGINPRKYRKQMQFDSRNQAAKHNSKKKEKFKRKFSDKS